MRKNTAGQIIGCQLVSKTDGSAVTSGTTTVYVTGDGGTQGAGSVGSGACTHEGQGFWTYAPAQAETNYDHVAFTFTNAAAVPVTVQVYPSFPQTGDNFARLGAPAGASVSADVAAVKTDTGNLVTRITATLFSGITQLSHWLGALAGKQAADGTAQTEIRASGAGSGTFDPTTDSNEAIRDRGDAAWITATGFSTLDAAGVRTAVGLGSANLDTQLGDLPTNAELATALAAADDAVLAAVATVDGVVDAIKLKTDQLTFTNTGEVDANLQSVNDTALEGDGAGTPWGPA